MKKKKTSFERYEHRKNNQTLKEVYDDIEETKRKEDEKDNN
jgi:hypothetical protein